MTLYLIERCQSGLVSSLRCLSLCPFFVLSTVRYRSYNDGAGDRNPSRVIRMKKDLFATSSLTYAYKARDVLSYTGIKSNVIRLDGSETRKGCRFGVSVDQRDARDAAKALRNAGIPFTEP